MKKLIAIFAVLISALSFSGCTPTEPNPAVNSVRIEDAWVGGETEIAKMVQVHEVVDGMMQEKKGGIVIKPGETVTLEPGGLHIMIMNITKPIVAGDRMSITIKFDGADAQTLELVAKDSAGGDEEYTE
jgi:copper(I)-binding protein